MTRSIWINHLTESDKVQLVMFGIYQTSLEKNCVLPTHVKVVEHGLQFKLVNTLQINLNKGWNAIGAFTQVAIAQKIMIGPFNSAPIAAVDLIGPKLGRLAKMSASTSEEIEARKVALQNALLLFLSRLRTNSRERYTSIVAKRTCNILEELVIFHGKLNAWAGAKEIWAPFDPQKP